MVTRRQGVVGAIVAAVAAVGGGFVRDAGAAEAPHAFSGLGYATFPILPDGSLGVGGDTIVIPDAIVAGFAQAWKLGEDWGADGYFIDSIALVAPERMGDFLNESTFSAFRTSVITGGYDERVPHIRVYFA